MHLQWIFHPTIDKVCKIKIRENHIANAQPPLLLRSIFNLIRLLLILSQSCSLYAHTQDVEGDQGLAMKGGALHTRCMKSEYNASFPQLREWWIDIAHRCSTTPHTHHREIVMGLV